jgi:hypothetical protein
VNISSRPREGNVRKKISIICVFVLEVFPGRVKGIKRDEDMGDSKCVGFQLVEVCQALELQTSDYFLIHCNFTNH